MVLKTGEQQFYEGLSWIVKHPDEFKELQKICLHIEAERNHDGTKRFTSITRSSVYMLAQIIGMPITNVKTFKRNNNLWSTISRYLVELHPQLDRVIERRECEVEKYVRAHGLPELPAKYVYINRAA